MEKEKAVLAYSGGLDTSVIFKWMLDMGYDVIPFMADLGQKADFGYAQEKVKKIGVNDLVVIDCKKEFVEGYVYPAIRANLMYEGRYPLGTALGRPLTALKQIELAQKLGAAVLAHGSTGKGNDQVRFELAYKTLMPKAIIYAPWKDPAFLARFKNGRDDLIDYAIQHNIPISQTKREPWSSDDNIMHTSYEAGMLENPASIPFERMFNLTKSPKLAPDNEELLDIAFYRGNPSMVRIIKSFEINPETGLPGKFVYGNMYTEPVEILTILNEIAGNNGIGRVDMCESRSVGLKSRGVYETPGGTVLHFAHNDLEGITLDREIIKMNAHLSIDLASDIYSGLWFSPERIARQKAIDHNQEYVNGLVRLGLYKGTITPKGRVSSNSLYNEKMASMHESGDYDQTKARGFIDISAVRLQASSDRVKNNLGLIYT